MKEHTGPFPAVAFEQMMDANVMAPLVATVSGEITSNIAGYPLGAARKCGRVHDVWLSVGESGKDDSNTLKLQANVKINGTSVLTTQPAIAHVSGEASTQKTTKVSGDTGVTQAVIDHDNNEFSDGDVLTYDLTQTRTATPTTEMANAVLVVELEPPSKS